ncbi:MAG: aromatic amino acid transport family protein [Candidatus Pacebacteria bacterium]|nr:aromatic amino acid transport family protein [Candidatus Paceibacterota bacterium]
MKISKPILASASLIGTIIGAGVFAIPYVVSRSGVLISLFYLILLGTVVLFLHLFYGEVVLRTNGPHQLTGYAKKYFGRGAKFFILIATIFGTVGTLLVYVILAGEFIKTIFPSFLTAQQGAVLFWTFLSLFVFWGTKSIAKLELVMSLAMFAIFGLIVAFCWPKIDISHYKLFDSHYLFLPFGVFLFSLVGWSTVPGLLEILEKKGHLKRVVIIASLVCVFVYLLFGFLTVGVAGSSMTDKVFESLAPFLGGHVILLGGLLGLLTVATSFVVSANYLKYIFHYDCRFPAPIAFLLSVLVPLGLFLVGFNRFIPVVSIVGTFVGLAEGVAISLLYQKAKQAGDRIPEYSLKHPRFLIYFVIIILAGGSVAGIINNFVRF